MSCANHPEVEEALQRCARCGLEFCGDCTIVIRSQTICAGCKDEALRDVLSGVGGDSALASTGSRVEAWLIDVVIFFVVIGVPPAVVGGGERLWSVVGWALYVACEALMVSRSGQTFGKAAKHIKVVSTNGAPLRPRQAWSRAVVRGLFLFCFGIVDDVPAYLTKERTAIHDLVAGTRVVKLR